MHHFPSLALKIRKKQLFCVLFWVVVEVFLGINVKLVKRVLSDIRKPVLYNRRGNFRIKFSFSVCDFIVC